MSFYKILENLITNGRFEKDDMTKKLNVFYAYNQITLEEYTSLINKVNPELNKDKVTVIEHKEETEHDEHTV
ncbi:hypothetical protein G8S49_11425 [Clostridium botulinum C]|uniref:Uncharacterized protein n=2 Tax=Clostridium botulinum TaxID=1491 RepID=A0A9Q4TSG4_CLOBO|nr:hypothetical protein [Clostridium botulinum]EGO86280.1 hypothetical protein CBCST_22825 [Clostridium botulinum C str. Stockholm]MCD3195764.1 hypothetical protein [Clostridium botulinum C]MCD3201180.1 hypothetical protein [Clostridium botulinum C]MCD3206650.1 hypothetical protein [Clostridium botulinum C]MCD3209351.1 hypothetical protein [Clostridium botulinum C]